MTMSKLIIYWFESLTMEEVFVITWIGILLIGAGLAFLGEWLCEKGNERNGEDG